MNALDRIRDYKLREIAERKATRPLAAVEAAARAAPPVRPFGAALGRAATSGFGLIAEIKRASPSKGLIRRDFRPASLARAYQAGGAACLSVLTDAPSFAGSEDHLVAARGAVDLPVLRKEFLFDPWQVPESRALGADCVLVILAAVSDAQAAELEAAASGWGMDVLLEVHDRGELDRALALRSPLIGINNRDLRTFATDLAVSRDLAPLVPEGRSVVAESGIASAAEVAELAGFGVRRILVGESLMRQADVAAATRALLAAPARAAGGA